MSSRRRRQLNPPLLVGGCPWRCLTFPRRLSASPQRSGGGSSDIATVLGAAVSVLPRDGQRRFGGVAHLTRRAAAFSHGGVFCRERLVAPRGGAAVLPPFEMVRVAAANRHRLFPHATTGVDKAVAPDDPPTRIGGFPWARACALSIVTLHAAKRRRLSALRDSKFRRPTTRSSRRRPRRGSGVLSHRR